MGDEALNPSIFKKRNRSLVLTLNAASLSHGESQELNCICMYRPFCRFSFVTVRFESVFSEGL